MPSIARLVLSRLRNIDEAELEPAPGFNLVHGDNGSGKTSLLEAIHLLALGRSFRNQEQRSLVQEGCQEATVYAEAHSGLSFAVQRPLRGKLQLRIAGKKADNLAELSRQLPLQLINAGTFQVLEGSPGERRRFLDWGVFHVEHGFLDCWRRARLALIQRNILLKQNAGLRELEPWTRELAHSGEQMDRYRRAYVEALLPHLSPQLAAFADLGSTQSLQLEYRRGWEEESPLDLLAQLEVGLGRDRKYGHSCLGPHRADLRFRLRGQDAVALLSRGQIKVLLCGLKIAQGKLLQAARQQACIYLVDDLPAELDARNREQVCLALAQLESQVYLSSIEAASLLPLLEKSALAQGKESKLFHVKHGKIAAS